MFVGRLHLTRGTVRNYLSEAMLKLSVSSRYAAVVQAERQGWL